MYGKGADAAHPHAISRHHRQLRRHHPSFAQIGARRRRRFRKVAQSAAPAGGKAGAAPPVASFWTSSEPTFDEGTYDRINAAMLSYAAIEVRGGWPTLAEGHCSSPA